MRNAHSTRHLALGTLLAGLCAAAATGFAEPNAPAKQHVPERLDQVRLIHPAAANRNHILVSNVGGAIPAEQWGTVVTFAASRLQLNIWTNAVDKFDIAAYALDPLKGTKDFGEKSKVCVFLLDDPKLATFTGAPGCWCAVNLRNILRDRPDPQTLKDRYAKMILKGLAYACGSGASLDAACSLSCRSITLKGMDSTGIQISPMAYFPMLEHLKVIGGNEIISPATGE